jgi:metallo-beta-lactamase class B
MTRSIRCVGLAAALLAATGVMARAQGDASWNEPFEGFRITGNLYFVGTRGLSSFLFVTPQGHILIDSGLEETVPLIIANIEKLGFKPTDVKILLSSHAHYDHVGGQAEMKRRTGAQVMAVGEDARALESGTDNSALGGPGWKPVKVDRVLKDGDTVSLGGVALTAHLTPGHTKGCTTWTTRLQEESRTYQALFIGGVSINEGVRLVGNTRHPLIIDDYARTFRVLRELGPDFWFAQHPNMFQMEPKAKRLRAGEKANPFLDRAGYEAFIRRAEESYLKQLAEERGQTPR